MITGHYNFKTEGGLHHMMEKNTGVE